MDNLSRVGARARSTVQSANTNGVERKDKEYGKGDEIRKTPDRKPKVITRFTDDHEDESLTAATLSPLHASARPWPRDARSNAKAEGSCRDRACCAHGPPKPQAIR